jgi:hypothetical protein
MSFGGGAMFGANSAGTPSAFNFSAPPPSSVSFPPSTSFGSNNFSNGFSTDGSENDDPRADTTGEEAARRKRGFERGNTEVTTPFGAPPNMFSQQNSQQPSVSNPFNFSSSQPASSSNSPDKPLFSFNPPQPSKPTTFNAPAQQSSGAIYTFPPRPSLQFGMEPTYNQSASNIFGGLGQQTQTQTTQPAATGIFGAAPIENPASSMFGFNSTPQQSSSGISFNSTLATDRPGNNLFGTPQPEKPNSNIFGVVSLPDKAPAPSMFGTLGQSTATNNLFGSQPSAAQPISNIFGSQEQKPASAPNTNNLFGGGQTLSSAPSKPDLFAPQKSEPTPSGSMFGTKSMEATSDLFNCFDKQSAPVANNPFANLNKPVDQPLAQPKVNGNSMNGTVNGVTPSASGTVSSSMISSAPSGTLFGTSKPAVSINMTFHLPLNLLIFVRNLLRLSLLHHSLLLLAPLRYFHLGLQKLLRRLQLIVAHSFPL